MPLPPPSQVPPARLAPRGQTDRTGGPIDGNPGAARRPPRSEVPGAGPALRLAIGPAGLGIELARPARIACLTATELSIAIPGVRFPLDVSGGVSRFRNRRGRLLRMTVELPVKALEAWLGAKLRGLLGAATPSLWLSVRAAGATVGLVDDGQASPRILAFDVALDARGGGLQLTVHGARGAALPAPACALALRAVHAAVGDAGTREGSTFVLPSVAQSIARAVLPEAGVRAPDASDVHWTGLGAQADAWILVADCAGGRADVTEEAAWARESAVIARLADDALFDGELDTARAHAVAALERAPKHRELCRRIADIDRVAGGRTEAALATMVDAERRDPARLSDGLLVAELLAEAGDTDAAVATFARVGETEPVAPLAARAFERAAELTGDPHDALVWLDMAMARSPGIARVRWSRLARRLAAGRIEDALADAEHLEAQAVGTRARHDVWKRAGEAWGKAGRAAEASALYERALRFDPKDPSALAGLGRALIASHRAPRGTALLERALDAMVARGEAPTGLMLELATALAEQIDDRPAAIARAASVGSDTPEAPRARGLEGRWRAQLGDVAGASFAFARLRELADARVSGGGGAVVPLLVEAATFEREIRGDLLSAQRHLAVALRLSPHHAAARDAYREVGLHIAGIAGPGERRKTEPPSAAFEIALAGPDEPAASDAGAGDEDRADDEARAELLMQRLHATPDDDALTDELVDLLSRLGRGHELLALLSARLEDAGPERRAALLPRQRDVLGRLAREARSAGRSDEAALFEDALAILG